MFCNLSFKLGNPDKNCWSNRPDWVKWLGSYQFLTGTAPVVWYGTTVVPSSTSEHHLVRVAKQLQGAPGHHLIWDPDIWSGKKIVILMYWYYRISRSAVLPIVLAPPNAGLVHFVFDGCKVRPHARFHLFLQTRSLLLRSGELLCFCLCSSRWSMMAKLLASKALPMEEPVCNMPAVAFLFGWMICCISRWCCDPRGWNSWDCGEGCRLDQLWLGIRLTNNLPLVL